LPSWHLIWMKKGTMAASVPPRGVERAIQQNRYGLTSRLRGSVRGLAPGSAEG
jgi:hypothetical protein